MRKHSISVIVSRFLQGKSLEDYDIRISIDSYDKKVYLRKLSCGAGEFKTLAAYKINDDRLIKEISLYHNMYDKKSTNIISEIVKQEYDVDVEVRDIEVYEAPHLNYQSLTANGNKTIYHDGMSRLSEFDFNIRNFMRAKISDNHVSAVDMFEGQMFAKPQIREFIHDNIDDNVICRVLANRKYDNYLNKAINYLDVSNDDNGKLSYMTLDRVKKLPYYTLPDLYEPKRRYHTKPSKAIRKLFKNPDMFTAQEYEGFTRLWNKRFNPNIEFTLKVAAPKDIPRYYKYSSYESQNGTLGGSCMRNVDEEFFEIYAENCDGMLISVNGDDKINGRALLWTMDNGDKVMDRVYMTNEDTLTQFLFWAKDNGYIRKKHQSYDAKDGWVRPTGEEFYNNYNKSLKREYDHYPYVDSLTYMSGDRLLLSNVACDFHYQLTGLHGGYEDNENLDLRSCDDCNDTIREDDEQYCEFDGEVYCPNCASWSSVENDYVPTHIATYSAYHNEDIFQSHSLWSEHHNYSFHQDDENHVYVDSENSYICRDLLVFSDKMDSYLLISNATQVTTASGQTDWIPEDDAVWSDSLSTHLVEADAQENEDGDWVYELEEQTNN